MPGGSTVSARGGPINAVVCMHMLLLLDLVNGVPMHASNEPVDPIDSDGYRRLADSAQHTSYKLHRRENKDTKREHQFLQEAARLGNLVRSGRSHAQHDASRGGGLAHEALQAAEARKADLAAIMRERSFIAAGEKTLHKSESLSAATAPALAPPQLAAPTPAPRPASTSAVRVSQPGVGADGFRRTRSAQTSTADSSQSSAPNSPRPRRYLPASSRKCPRSRQSWPRRRPR